MDKERFTILSLLLLGLLLVGGAMLYTAVHSSADPVTPTGVALLPVTPSVTQSPTHTPSPTETVPPTWTPTFTPSATPTWTPTPSPTLTPSLTPTPLHPLRPTADYIRITVTPHPSATLPIPTPVPRQSISNDAVTILLLGSDQRPDWNDWHTDAIQYVVVYPDIPSVAMLSIPRDLYVYIPNFWMSRINFADMYGTVYNYDGGGFGLFNQTLLYNLGITADHYVKVNFDGLIGLVDAMGGIDVPVHCRLADHWPYPDENGEYPWLELEPRIHHMDGELALWYSRSRKTTSVFSREERQQQVLEAMWRKAKQANLLEAAPSVDEQWNYLFDTNMGVGNILNMAVVAARLDPMNVYYYNIGYGEVEYFVTPYGGSVFLPHWNEIEPVVNSVLARPSSQRATQSAIPVEVWNGTTLPDRDLLAADTLIHRGFNPIVGEPDRRDYAETQIVFFGGTTKGSGLSFLQSIFRVDQQHVITVEEPERDVRLRLILGADYDPCR
ncbi:MAG: LCP family protein [Anaerolineae bacterium]